VNFFEAQDNARKATRWLVFVYILATALIVAGVTALVAVIFYSNSAQPDRTVLLMTAAAALTLIVLSTLYKVARLSAGGGGSVARAMGGVQVPPDVQDPLRRRLRNVVEEMSIASGVPVPEIYVLEREAGINAFAAGFAPGDAAIAVTRGTLELLNRDELQCVIAHEFSHILNGDMRLSMRIMGVLFGIMVLGLIGRIIVRGGRYSRLASSRRGKGAGGVILLGVGLLVLGWIGVFFARIVKAAISRQREYLADASAVQFTRQTQGLANALKKIGGYKAHSFLKETDPEEVSHMLFARGSRLSSLFATHPPLVKRIQTLEPNFREEDLPQVEYPAGQSVTDEDAATSTSGFADASDHAPLSSIQDSVGNPAAEHIVFAAGLRSKLPTTLYDAAHAPGDAWLLTVALFVQQRGDAAERSFDVLAQQLGRVRSNQMREYWRLIGERNAAVRLPLLEIAFPVLRRTPTPQLEFLVRLCRRLVELDGVVELHEFCLLRILERSLGEALAPSTLSRGRRGSKREVRDAALMLLRIVAERGNHTDKNRQRAFEHGVSVFGDWAGNSSLAHKDGGRHDAEALETSLDVLERLDSKGTRTLVDAIAAAVSADGRLATAEAELLRAVCASLNCPLPPLEVERSDFAYH